jgi:hypothetical protein
MKKSRFKTCQEVYDYKFEHPEAQLYYGGVYPTPCLMRGNVAAPVFGPTVSLSVFVDLIAEKRLSMIREDRGTKIYEIL